MTATTRDRATTGTSTSTAPAGRPARDRGPARRVRAALTTLSGRVHAAADTRARETGWTLTVLPGPAGLSGRSYRDPRFGAGPGR